MPIRHRDNERGGPEQGDAINDAVRSPDLPDELCEVG
jgi:hypothetical protein